MSIKELSDLTEIPEKRIEDWAAGIVVPDFWLIKLLEGYLKQYPQNHLGIVTKSKGVYTIDQIKEIVLPLAAKYPIYQMVICGDYASRNPKETSVIEIIVEGKMDKSTVSDIEIDIKKLILKDVDLLHENKISIWSNLYKKMKSGIVLYNCGMSINQVSEMIKL